MLKYVSPRLSWLAPLCLAGVFGCVHGSKARPVPLGPAAQALSDQARTIGPITAEEDYFDAKLIAQALPENAPASRELRAKMLEYLLAPIAGLDAEELRKNPSLLGSEDDFDRLSDSFRDALDAFSTDSLWTPDGLHLSAREQELLVRSAKLLVAVHSPRGNELPVATALFLLTSIDGDNPEWRSRIDQLFTWLEDGTTFASGSQGPRHLPTPTDVLETVASVWPAPDVLNRLSEIVLAREDRVTTILRRPIGRGEGAHSLLSELLIDSQALSNMAVTASALYVRCGQMERAAQIAARFTDKPGDDPNFRQLLDAAAKPHAKLADLLAFARRFLPRSDLLRGTAPDRIDPATAMGVLHHALASYPNDLDLLVLASRVARLLSAPLLSLRFLDEAIATPAARNAGPDTLGDLEAERMELAFLRLKMHVDPERMSIAEHEAAILRKEIAEERRRFGPARFKLDDADIDLVLAGGMVDAGQADRATPLLKRVQRKEGGNVTVVRQLASLAVKRGSPQQAIALLRQAIEERERNAPPEDTLPYVEGQARLSYLLGNAYDLLGDQTEARKAWAAAARGWERLMLEQLRRKNLSASAEATFEVGRLYYLLGRRDEGLRKLDEAIAQDEDRDQSYLDSISFLVQRGESEAALDIYRRALSRPGRSVSEYVKVYASLWILDLTARSTNEPDAGASAYLRGIAGRKVVLRPPRAAVWYSELARYATGQIDYATLLAKADTAGKRAEAYFYEAMRRLSKGRSDEAHALWSKVMETKMTSFFEFEMALRYLRTGAPARPETSKKNETI